MDEPLWHEEFGGEVVSCAFGLPVMADGFALLDVDMEAVVVVEQVVAKLVGRREAAASGCVHLVDADHGAVVVFEDEPRQLVGKPSLEDEHTAERGEVMYGHGRTVDAG